MAPLVMTMTVVNENNDSIMSHYLALDQLDINKSANKKCAKVSVCRSSGDFSLSDLGAGSQIEKATLRRHGNRQKAPTHRADACGVYESLFMIIVIITVCKYPGVARA